MSEPESTAPPPQVKACSRCGETKPYDAFGPDKRASSGRRSECNACRAADYAANPEPVKARTRAWALANPERYKEVHDRTGRARYAANRERERARSTAWRAANPELRRAIVAAWDRANPEKRRGAEEARRGRKAAAFVEHVDGHVLHERDGGRCRYCGVAVTTRSMHVEHVVPLSRGGEHSYANTVTSCAPCNIRKGARLPEEVGMRLL